ncbi:MAG: hypothetical protein A2073_08020 [Deltaproteobacteria bacterium GWC2_42_11]|nr:MAG: hypothetical protein A2073_08020 [Deltaproteobacteria bacterium GWC2_42_11]HBO85313.1 hypothetical protein [Deltaproteobacteria bacterium]
MPKLSKKEIILFSLMLAAVFYGIYNFTGTASKPDKGADKKFSDVKSLIANITAGSAGGLSSELDNNIVARAETEWQNDPFYEKKLYKEWTSPKSGKKTAEELEELYKSTEKAEVPEQKVNFNYTGYIELGNKKIAIINDAEYEQGERLESEGYILKSISRSNIVIEDKPGNKELDILLQE